MMLAWSCTEALEILVLLPSRTPEPSLDRSGTAQKW